MNLGYIGVAFGQYPNSNFAQVPEISGGIVSATKDQGSGFFAHPIIIGVTTGLIIHMAVRFLDHVFPRRVT